jgi:hypothetical protein
MRSVTGKGGMGPASCWQMHDVDLQTFACSVFREVGSPLENAVEHTVWNEVGRQWCVSLVQTAEKKLQMEKTLALFRALSGGPMAGILEGSYGEEVSTQLETVLSTPEEWHDVDWANQVLRTFYQHQEVLIRQDGFLERWTEELVQEIQCNPVSMPLLTIADKVVTSVLQAGFEALGLEEKPAEIAALVAGFALPTRGIKALAKAARLAVGSEVALLGTKAKAIIKGGWGEAAAVATKDFKGYTSMPCRLSGNRGIDHVFVKYGVGGKVEDIVVVESKFATKGGAPKLARDSAGQQQLSNAWMQKQENLLAIHHPETHSLLKANQDKIRFKANVLDKNGVNRWHDYGKYDPGKTDMFNAIRTPKGGK